MLWCGWFYSTPWAYNLPPLMGMQQWTVRVFAGENSREILKDERFTVFLVFDLGEGGVRRGDRRGEGRGYVGGVEEDVGLSPTTVRNLLTVLDAVKVGDDRFHGNGNKEKGGVFGHQCNHDEGGSVITRSLDLTQAGTMDSIVDSLNNAYQDFVAAAANVLEAKENAGSIKTMATDTALENFKQKWELFRVACDQAEEFVESVKQRIGSECLVDEATRPVAGKPGQATMTGLPPISAVRLEQMSKAVRWLVIELQHGSGAGSANSALTHPSAPFDARFSEDAAQ
ncbi:Mediator of RNA polymerase II transcription subunit 32 isoform B [Glycine soja]|nr:Mediator of RNA polymerase II transcription subunit 32 isoform A [Glycine soja]RZC16243.1 Mediator of RNA polymerase II transcription subunit 32 isoform B [Glycine soja]